MENRRASSPLGEFIKSRRNRLQPEAVGIQPFPGRRRTPGLRREEVAYLANISVTYYSWLEQGREKNPSFEVLSHLSQALRLDEDERKHLFDLAQLDSDRFDGGPKPQKPNAEFLQNLVNQLHYPSYIANEVADLLVWNRGAELVVADFGRLPASERNMASLLFLDSEHRNRLINWEEYARYLTALIRASFDSHRDKPPYMDRFEQLMRNSEDFARLWERHEIRQKDTVPVHYRLQDGQELNFTIHCAASLDNDPGLHWCFFVPIPGTGTEEKLELLLTRDGESSS